MNSSKEKLKSYVDVCAIHAERLQISIDYVECFFPVTEDIYHQLSKDDIAYLDLLSNRFAKLQDTIGQKIFPLILDNLQEDFQIKPFFIDILNRIEKIGFLDHASVWLELRDVRNLVSHEYPNEPEKLIKDLNIIYESAKIILFIWRNLCEKMKKADLI